MTLCVGPSSRQRATSMEPFYNNFTRLLPIPLAGNRAPATGSAVKLLATAFMVHPRGMQPEAQQDGSKQPATCDEPQAFDKFYETIVKWVPPGCSMEIGVDTAQLLRLWLVPGCTFLFSLFCFLPFFLFSCPFLAPCARVCHPCHVVMERLTRKLKPAFCRVEINRAEMRWRRSAAQLRIPARAPGHPSPSPCCRHAQSATRQQCPW